MKTFRESRAGKYKGPFGLGSLALFFVLSLPARAQVWPGLYTDATTYQPEDPIEVYVSVPITGDAEIRLVRLDTELTGVASSGLIPVGPQETHLGSFLQYPVTLANRTAFTLEGWIYPTLLGGDTVVVAGQYGEDMSSAAILLTDEGRLAGYVGDTDTTDPSKWIVAPAGDLSNFINSWHHVALTFGNTGGNCTLRLYLDGVCVGDRIQPAPEPKKVPASGKPFRLGARSEAPGDQTGVFDGRLDSWALWPVELSETAVMDRKVLGETV